MNIKEVAPDTNGTLPHYIAVAIPLTIATIWIVVAFQSKYIFPDGTNIWVRLGWPVRLCLNLLYSRFNTREKEMPIGTSIKDESHW